MNYKSNTSYFLTNNLGGGGTNVSRFVSYLNLLDNSSVDLLLNYYYLETNFKKTMSFDQTQLKELKNSHNLKEFLFLFGEAAATKHKVSDAYTYKKPTWNPLILLDSGSGNILRDISPNLRLQGSYVNIYKKIIYEYHNFAERLKVNITIALDFAPKYTYKKSEAEDLIYQKIRNVFEEDVVKNQFLVKSTLELLNKSQFNQKIFVPLHGASQKLYVDYLHNVLETENTYQKKFDGFAIGGVGNTRKLDSKIWHIGEGSSQNIKSILIPCRLIKNIKKILTDLNDNRHLHLLGAGAIRNVIPLIYSGVNSFDCHTPWRRASDGDNESAVSLREKRTISTADWSKFLSPLLDSKMNLLENKNSLSYIKINEARDNLGCDCPVCRQFNMHDIQKLYIGNNEDNYFSKILIFLHAVWQYDYIIKLMSDIGKDDNKLHSFIKIIPNKALKADYEYCLGVLS